MTAPALPVAAPVAAPVSFHGWDRRYAPDTERIIAMVREIGESDEFILKARVAELEERVAAQVGVRHGVGVASATGALLLTLRAMGIGRGDEVVAPAFSFVSAASTVAAAGARPVFADVDEATATLDPAAAAAAVGPATRALLPAHLFSCTADMPALRGVADRHGLALVENSAVSFGAVTAGRPAGAHGDAGVFSFFPGKPLGGIGDAGMVVTDDDELAATVRMLRNHGQRPGSRFLHETVGYNCRMDELSAGFLLQNLASHQANLAARRERAAWYEERLGALAEVALPPGDYAGRSVYTFVVRVRERDALRRYLAGRGVETVVYYPLPLPLQPMFAELGHRAGEFPVAERLAGECVALPLRPDLGRAEIDRVADEIHRFYGSGALS